MTQTTEAAFESAIEAHLLANGYVPIGSASFDRDRAIFADTVLGFIRETQPAEWARLEAQLAGQTGEQILADLCRRMDDQGALATLRHGFKCYGRTLRIAYFKAAHELNPEFEARYAANVVGVTRQLRFSPRSGQSLDVVLSVNGVPVVTLELKNAFTGQTVEDARRQYQRDRDPREPVFVFKRRTLVHFAVDTESVLMTTRLAGSSTRFLPFNKGSDGGAGNPDDPNGRSYHTAYLWEEVLERGSLLDLLARFLHLQSEEPSAGVREGLAPRMREKRDDQGRKAKAESLIFPRYHQLQAVRQLVDMARPDGVGHNALVEHSAGSGKSNTIAWLAHRLASLHDAQSVRVFDSVIVVTDRIVLDQQLQDTIYQFEHKHGVVQKVDESSRQLAEALASRVPIVITTLQKFPFVSRQLLKMAEERGEESTGALPTRRCAVIIDEAHSSQGGETATAMKEVLAGEELREQARRRAAEEGVASEEMEALFLSMARRGRQANLSFFAFTATPKHKTLKIFGRDGEATHRYTMRQAIEEGFILDVLRNYVSYSRYHKLLKASNEDPNVERKKAASALARFVQLHPHNIAQKTEVMVEHFQAFTRHKIRGRAKAMADETLRETAAVNSEERFELTFKTLVDNLFTERMEQNEEIFIRYMNDAAFRQVVSQWMGTEAYRRLRRAIEASDSDAAPQSDLKAVAGAPRLKLVEGRPEERYVTCVPLVPLAAAAGAFSDPQNTEAEDDWQWVAWQTERQLAPGMFVARIVGHSMEPAVPDGAYALFRAPVTGTRQGKTVLVQLRDFTDPETGGRYTVKRYQSEKAESGDSWRHVKVTLKPSNPEFAPIVLTDADEDAVHVVAELLEVIGPT